MALTMSHLHCRPWSQGRKFRPLEEGLETQAGPAAQHGSVIAGDNLFLQVVAPGGPGNAKAELFLPLVFTGPAELSLPRLPPAGGTHSFSLIGGRGGAGCLGEAPAATNARKAAETAEPISL